MMAINWVSSSSRRWCSWVSSTHNCSVPRSMFSMAARAFLIPPVNGRIRSLHGDEIRIEALCHAESKFSQGVFFAFMSFVTAQAVHPFAFVFRPPLPVGKPFILNLLVHLFLEVQVADGSKMHDNSPVLQHRKFRTVPQHAQQLASRTDLLHLFSGQPFQHF